MALSASRCVGVTERFATLGTNDLTENPLARELSARGKNPMKSVSSRSRVSAGLDAGDQQRKVKVVALLYCRAQSVGYPVR